MWTKFWENPWQILIFPWHPSFLHRNSNFAHFVFGWSFPDMLTIFGLLVISIDCITLELCSRLGILCLALRFCSHCSLLIRRGHLSSSLSAKVHVLFIAPGHLPIAALGFAKSESLRDSCSKSVLNRGFRFSVFPVFQCRFSVSVWKNSRFSVSVFRFFGFLKNGQKIFEKFNFS